MPTAVGQGAEPESIEALVIAGRKIEAIKLLRRESGLGLKEAKDQIDDLFRRLQPR
jgi:ribosomal protein L7/L12